MKELKEIVDELNKIYKEKVIKENKDYYMKENYYIHKNRHYAEISYYYKEYKIYIVKYFSRYIDRGEK